ncbi:MAG: hypothetical protein ACREBU_22800 [Nitrososphaera sp.]
MALIHRAEVLTNRWINTSGLPPDGKEHYRELRQYGNRHAILEPGAECGTVHFDQYNATDFPSGTLNHLAKFANEKTGIPEGAAKLGLTLLALYGIYRLMR